MSVVDRELRDVALDALARIGRVESVGLVLEVHEDMPEREWRRFRPGQRVTVVIEGAVDGDAE